MNKTLRIISLIIVLALTGCQSSLIIDPAAAGKTEHDTNAVINSMPLSVDIAVPETLRHHSRPNFVRKLDPPLQQHTQLRDIGWEYLTGQKLARYVIDQEVVITWNTSSIYFGSWIDRDDTGTIYMNPYFQAEPERKMIYIISEMAHEIFHGLAPFNQKGDTLYEEFFAYYVGTCVAGLSTQSFEHINPLSSTSLTQWFRANKPGSYLGDYEMYPEEMVAIFMP